MLDAPRMRRLNRRATGRQAVTDVIAFTLPQPDGTVLGDVYVCPVVAERWVEDAGRGKAEGKRGVTVTEIATATIDAGENEGVIVCPAEVEFIAGDQIYPIMPDPHDATLADWSMTLVLRR